MPCTLSFSIAAMPPKKKNRNLDDWEKDFAALDENGDLKEPEEAVSKPGALQGILQQMVRCSYE